MRVKGALNADIDSESEAEFAKNGIGMDRHRVDHTYIRCVYCMVNLV